MDIGNFKVLKKLGSGGFGAVYEAFDLRTGQEIALKIIDISQMDSEAIFRLLQECEVLQRVHHPNIIYCYGTEMEGEQVYTALELVKGQDLKEIMEDESILNYPEALRIIYELAQAVAALHREGIIHRDIKAENVIIETKQDGWIKKRYPKLVDFGLAWDLYNTDFVEDEEEIMGTPYYMAPEYIQGVDGLNPKVDVYALGVLLYYLVVGSYPFKGRNTPGTLEKHLRSPVPAISWLPKPVEQLIHDMLAKKPKKRPSSKDLVSRLEKLINLKKS